MGADPGSRRRSIQCAIGKDARMPKVPRGCVRRADKDRAVEVAKLQLSGVGYGAFGHDGLFDGEAQGLELRCMFGFEGETQRLRLAKGIECPAKGDIVLNRADARHPDRLFHVEDKGRHVEKRDVSDLACIEGRRCRHQAAGSLEPNRGGRAGSRKQPLFQHDRREPDDPVPAHRAVAFIMKKQHAGIGLRVCGSDQQAPVHVVVASGFPHERGAKVVQVRLAILAFFQDGGTGRLGEPARHHAQRFAGNVTVKGGDGIHG